VRFEDELTEEEKLELARATEQADAQAKEKEEDERADEEEQLPIQVRRYTEVVQAVRELVAGRDVDFETLLDLSDEERAALEELQAVLRGSDGTRFIYAEDRLAGLNRTLAVLQPVLGLAVFGAGVDELRSSFEEVVDDINSLRDKLQSLEDAEDLMFERREKVKEGEEDDDDEDDDDDADQPAEGEAAPAEGEAAPAEGEAPKPKKKKKAPSEPAPEAPPEGET
jgi:hypothetical protein